MATRTAADVAVRRPTARRSRRRRPAVLRALGSAPVLLSAAAGLAAAGIATLLLVQVATYRDGLVDARLDSLLATAEVFSAAIAAGGTAADGRIVLSPGRLEESGRGDVLPRTRAGEHPLAHPLDPDRVDRLVDRLAEPVGLRARVYDPAGGVIADSTGAPALPDLLRIPVPGATAPAADAPPEDGLPAWLAALVHRLERALGEGPLPSYPETQVLRADAFPEVGEALDGIPAAAARRTAQGGIALSVAVPVRRLQDVAGALLLETTRDEITPLLLLEQRRMLGAFAGAAIVAVVLAGLAGLWTAVPVRRLADRVSAIRRTQRPLEAPELERRGDAVGEVARDVAALTRRAAQRVEALEAFTADVAHELKNPLTSLRSACETLPLAASADSQKKLVEIIRHDVARIDRLISDISAASRLDAELSRRDEARVDLADLLSAVVAVQQELAAPLGQAVELTIRPPAARGELVVRGSDTRLGEVFTNLIDNARSFTPDGGRIEVTAGRRADFVEVRVDDEGPGIKEGMAERIFERFYTDRGDANAFGNNSGLGLSICRQIVEAYDGTIFAENRYTTSLGPDRRVLGARFVVQLPLAS